MEQIRERGEGLDRIGIRRLTGVGIIDKIEESAVWKIKRWASEEDRKNAIVYSSREAMRLFGGVKQETEVKAVKFPGAKFILPLIGKARLLKGNVLLNEGIDELWTIICSSGGTKFDNASAYLGVGNSATGEQATDTGLIGASKLYKVMDGSYPTYGTSQLAVWRSTFASGDANFAWEEFTVANGGSDGDKNLNRKTSSEGTKQSGQVWELTLTITLS